MDRAATFLSWLFNPLCAVTVLCVAVGVTHPTWWGPDLVTWILLAGVPALLLGIGLHAGIWHDPDISALPERRTFLPWVALSSLLLAGWAVVGQFPAGLRFMTLAIACWLVIAAGVSLAWKISLHVGSTLGAALLGAYLIAHWLAMVAPGLALAVAWARVRLRQHTVAQVIAGGMAAMVAVAFAARLTPP
ncbi:MAG: hypothetical protein K6V97_15065 [Actinomycetia bacterium]|nr:hypothetical protein [Actinomycetes bacterium]